MCQNAYVIMTSRVFVAAINGGAGVGCDFGDTLTSVGLAAVAPEAVDAVAAAEAVSS